MLWPSGLRGQEIAASADTAPAIEVRAAPDEEIRKRISGIFSQIEGLRGVGVAVDSGVVTLSGVVPGARASRDALAIAGRTEGVVHVQDRLEEEVNLKARVRPATRKFQELGGSVLRILPVALLSLAVAGFFWFLGRWAGERGLWLRRFGLTELGASLGRRIIRAVVTAVGLVIALEILDATAVVGALLGVAGVAGIALGFAFRNIVENYLAGVLLSARNPFRIGDQVQIGDFNGKVVRLTSRDTVLMTLDGNHLRIPNSVIITSAMMNFSRNPLRRFEFNVGVSVDLDLVTARDLGMATLRSMKGVLADPGPQGLVAELGDSAVQLTFLGWIDQRETDFPKARSEAIRRVKTAFDKAGIEMPEPIYRVHLRKTAKSMATGAPTPESASVTHEADVATDRTIDDQVADELRSSGEENLLDKGPA